MTHEQDLAQSAIIEATKKVVNNIFQAANDKQYLKGLDYYAGGDNTYFVSDGVIHTLEKLKTIYATVGETVEDLHNEILEWHCQVLTPELVNYTLPVKLRLKFKGIPEYTGQIIWSATLQKIDGQWLVIQSHESWLNAAEVAAALTPEATE